MIISVLIFALIWSATSLADFIVPSALLASRMLYIGRPQNIKMLALPVSAGIIALVIWYLASGIIETAYIAGLRSALTALLAVHLFPASDHLLNSVTVRIPLVRDLLLVSSRTITFISQIFDDVLYTYRIEARKARGVKRLQLLVASFAVVTSEIVEFIERLELVVESRGRYPRLSVWFEPVPVRAHILFIDLALVVIVLLALLVH